MVRRQSGDDNSLYILLTQLLFERCSNERIVCVLHMHAFSVHRNCYDLGFLAYCAMLEHPGWRKRQMMDVVQRSSRCAPCDQQCADILLGTGIVSFTPAFINETLLHVYKQQRGATGELKRANALTGTPILDTFIEKMQMCRLAIVLNKNTLSDCWNMSKFVILAREITNVH